jgi:polar amino acid transport system substrate-binding protein
MCRFKSVLLLVSVILTAFAVHAWSAEDTLSQVKHKGVLVAGVKDSLPPFGYIDEKTRQIVGYDVDFVRAIADRLGVKLQLKPVSSASRIPQLMEGNIDIIAATTSKNPQRMEQIDFSHAYFFTVQKFLVKTGTVKNLSDLEGKKIGTAKGSDSEQNLAQALPSVTILSFDDYPQAFLALQQGKVFAVTTDAPILAGILEKAPNKAAFEIPDIHIYDEAYGLGMRKGDKAFADFVNETLLEMEQDGQAGKIFDKWFGPGTATPLTRTFTITADK